MTEQASFRMPATGEAWRHYKGDLYTVIGMARDDHGDAFVVYTEYRWGLVQLPPIYTQPLGRFVQEIENNKPRFRFERESGDDDRCPFIRAEIGPEMSNSYTCAACGGTFDKAWSDDEAKAELDETFAVPVELCSLVCDDCYRKMMGLPPEPDHKR